MSNSIRSLKLTGFLLVTVLGISSAHAIQLINVEPVLGTFFVRHCLTVKGGSTANGTPLQGDRCESIFGQDATFAHQDATFAQEWNWEFFGIQGIGTDALGSRCIDVAGGGTADRTPSNCLHATGRSRRSGFSETARSSIRRAASASTSTSSTMTPVPRRRGSSPVVTPVSVASSG